MTKQKFPAIFDRSAFAPLFDHSVGFDSMFDKIFDDFLPAANSVSYPPYNIRKAGADRIIEIALAGYSEDDLDITVANNILTVAGDKVETSPLQAAKDYYQSNLDASPEFVKDTAEAVEKAVPATVKQTATEMAEKVEAATPEYLYKGIANRKFSRQFQLADNAEVTAATFINGMLSITVSVAEPEESVLKIAINGE